MEDTKIVYIEKFGIATFKINWYITASACKITVNAHSHTIITAHKVRE